MPPPRARWPNLIVGLVCSAALVVGAVAVLVFARVGALRGDTVRLYATTQMARGVFPGTDVWLEGQKIGRVAAVRFRAPSTDTTERLLVELEILERQLPYLRHDSWTQIRAGGTMIGTPVVWVHAGSAAAPAVRAGDTLPMRPQGDAEDVMARAEAAAEQFPKIMADFRRIGGALDSARGTAGSVLGDERGRKQLEVVRGRAAGLVQRATRGSGTSGLLLRGGVRDLAGRARAAVAGTDSLRAMLASRDNSFGRFRRDSTLMATVEDLRNEVSIVRRLLAGPNGTAGRALHDSALYDQLGQLQRELGALMQDMKDRPLRYLSATF